MYICNIYDLEIVLGKMTHLCFWCVKSNLVQRRATKFITLEYSLDYKERLTVTDLLPLSYRRDILDITLFYNSVHTLNDYNYQQFSLFIENQLRFGHCLNIVSTYQVSRKELYFNFYMFRIILLRNNLPTETKDIHFLNLVLILHLTKV